MDAKNKKQLKSHINDIKKETRKYISDVKKELKKIGKDNPRMIKRLEKMKDHLKELDEFYKVVTK